MSATILEHETETGRCGMSAVLVVVEHPEHGRLLLVEGFGGLDAPQGGAYRWEHGTAYRLRPGDTFASLRAEPWNEITSTYEAMLRGYDDSRPLLEWSGHAVRAVAESAVAA